MKKKKKEGTITEIALVLPALYLMEQHNGIIKASALYKGLALIMHPTGNDIRILNKRKDTYFSQIARNLKCHDSLTKNGYAHYELENNKRDGTFQIRESGAKYLNRNIEVLELLFSDNFSYEDTVEKLAGIEALPKENKVNAFDENININEGSKNVTSTYRYERSKQLKEYACNAFAVDGQISCACCNFNFNQFYGNELGGTYIEIHHIKPIFKYQDEDMEKTMKEALANLVPLCSNCHRMIHRKRNNPLKVEDLKEAIEQTYMMHTIPIALP